MLFSSLTVFPVVAFILIIYFMRSSDLRSWIGSSLIGAFLVFWVALGVSFILRAMAPVTSSMIEYNEVKIVALSSSTSINGSFFLGSGNIEGNPYYFFYFATPDGGKKMDKLRADLVTLYEEDRKDAFMAKISVRTEWKNEDQLFRFFAPLRIKAEEEMGQQYAIHVPKGSIKEGINLDLPR